MTKEDLMIAWLEEIKKTLSVQKVEKRYAGTTPKNSAPLNPVKEREASISPDSGRRSALTGRDGALSVNPANIRSV